MARADQTPIGSPVAGGIAADREDPELIALPAPPSGRRIATLALMAAVVAASIALAASLRGDVAYFFSSPRPIDLGDVSAVDPATLTPNTFVRVSGTPSLAGSVRYRRIVTGEQYVVAPLAGQQTIYVHMPASMEHTARTEHTGRLVTFGQLGGRMRDVQEHFARRMDMPASGESFVLLLDEPPASSVWALGLVILCGIFVIVDLALVLRWFRPRAAA